MRSGFFKFAAVFVGLSMAVTPLSVDAKSKKEPASYTTYQGKKSQKYLKLAMTLPMETLLDGAVNFKPDFVYAYGLALELGRTPATFKMKESEKQHVLSVFRDVLVLYVQKKDNIELKGTEAILLDQPDFWITIARSMSFKPIAPQISSLGGSGGVGGAADQRLDNLSASQYIDPNSFSEQRFQLTGDPMINPSIVSAGQSCAMAARAGARMQKVMKIDAHSAPHLTPDELKEKQAQASVIFGQSVSVGNVACGTKGFFKKVFIVALDNLGSLNRLNDDPAIAKQVEEKTSLPDDPAPEAK